MGEGVHANVDDSRAGDKKERPFWCNSTAASPLGPLMQKMQNLGLATLQLSLSFGSRSDGRREDKWQGMARPAPIATAIVSI